MTGVPVIVVAPDDHALRMLDVTLRLGGFASMPRSSVDDARRLRNGDPRPLAVVIDLRDRALPLEGADVRTLQDELRVPVVVIVGDDPAVDRGGYERAGARVLVDPYPPAELYRAVGRA